MNFELPKFRRRDIHLTGASMGIRQQTRLKNRQGLVKMVKAIGFPGIAAIVFFSLLCGSRGETASPHARSVPPKADSPDNSSNEAGKAEVANDKDSKSDSEDDAEDDDVADDQADASGTEVVGNVTLASDYILRGFTQTDHRPALQGGFDWEQTTGFYLGVWGSNVYFPDDDVANPTLELDYSGGYQYQFNKSLSVRLGLTYYAYYDDFARNGVNLPLKVQYKSVSAEINYSPNWQGAGQSWYFILSWQKSLPLKVSLGASLGYAIVQGNEAESYPDAEISLTREFFGVDLAVAGIFVQQQVINDAQSGSAAVFSASQSF